MQISQRDRAEQDHGQPIIYRLHPVRLRAAAPIYKRLAKFGLCWPLLVIVGCASDNPTGQVLAEVDGVDVTAREIQSELSVSRATGIALSPDDALQKVVVRKALAIEAEAQGLDRDARYHFELRRARDLLLVDTLRRNIRNSLPDPTDTQVAEQLQREPWRHPGRYILALEPFDDTGGDERIVLDSADFDRDTADRLRDTGAGDTLVFGSRNWKVMQKSAAPLGETRSRALAQTLWREQQVENRMNAIALKYRQNGKIRYQNRSMVKAN